MIKFRLYYGHVVDNCFDANKDDTMIYNSSDDYQGIRNIIWTQTQSVTDKLEFDMNPLCEFYGQMDVGPTHLITLCWRRVSDNYNHALRFFPITIEQDDLSGELHVTCASSMIFASWLPMIKTEEDTSSYLCDLTFGGSTIAAKELLFWTIKQNTFEFADSNIFIRGSWTGDVYMSDDDMKTLVYLDDKYQYIGKTYKEYIDAVLSKTDIYYVRHATGNTNNVTTEYGRTTRFYDLYRKGTKDVFAEKRLKDVTITNPSMIKSFKHTRDLEKRYTWTGAYHTAKQNADNNRYYVMGSSIRPHGSQALWGKRVYAVSVEDDYDVATVATAVDKANDSMDDYDIVINPVGMESDEIIQPCDCIRIDISQQAIELHGTFIVTEMKRYIDNPTQTTFKVEAVTLDDVDGCRLNSTFILGQCTLPDADDVSESDYYLDDNFVLDTATLS